MKTLTQYIRENAEKNIIDHAFRARINEAGAIEFYIHPQYQDGETLDFVIDKGFAWDPQDVIYPRDYKGT